MVVDKVLEVGLVWSMDRIIDVFQFANGPDFGSPPNNHAPSATAPASRKALSTIRVRNRTGGRVSKSWFATTCACKGSFSERFGAHKIDMGILCHADLVSCLCVSHCWGSEWLDQLQISWPRHGFDGAPTWAHLQRMKRKYRSCRHEFLLWRSPPCRADPPKRIPHLIGERHTNDGKPRLSDQSPCTTYPRMCLSNTVLTDDRLIMCGGGDCQHSTKYVMSCFRRSSLLNFAETFVKFPRAEEKKPQYMLTKRNVSEAHPTYAQHWGSYALPLQRLWRPRTTGQAYGRPWTTVPWRLLYSRGNRSGTTLMTPTEHGNHRSNLKLWAVQDEKRRSSLRYWLLIHRSVASAGRRFDVLCLIHLGYYQ